MDEPKNDNGVSEAPSSQVSGTAATRDTLISYIKKICDVFLGAEATQNLTFESSNQTLDTFLTDVKHPSLAVQHIPPIKASEEGDDNNTVGTAKFSIALEVAFTDARAQTIVFIKRSTDGILLSKDAHGNDVSIASQLQVVNLPVGSPIESLHTCVHGSLAPFLNSYVRTNEAAQRESGTNAVQAVQQKMSELEASLYNAKQNMQIESVVLDFHPDIVQASKKAQADGKTLKAEMLSDKANDTVFLNELQASVNVWIQKIERVTKLERLEQMPVNGATIEEVNFWRELDTELQHISEQLRSAEAQTSMALLKQAKRYWATMAFDTDTVGVKRAADLAKAYAPLTSQLPLAPLRQAPTVAALRTAVADVFSHLQRASQASSYPVERHLRLLDALARDVAERVVTILHARRLLATDYPIAEATAAECAQLFAAWRTHFAEYYTVLKKLAARRGQHKLPIKLSVDNKPLEERVSDVRRFRTQHEQLRAVIAHALPTGDADIDAAAEIESAYKLVVDVDELAALDDPTSPWSLAVRQYDERVDRVEAVITSQLRDRLATAQSAAEMFRVCSKFNALFFRPRIRGAIREYQTQLIARVEESIKTLHQKFKEGYAHSEASYVSGLRDMPPVAGAILWARQIERQLNASMTRVENVLGEGWELDVDGQRLKQDADRFRAKLNTDAIFERWVADTEARPLEVTGRVLDVKKRAGGVLSLDIHFADHLITLFKEVRNLTWLGFRVPFSISHPAQRAKAVYPLAVSLRETLRTYDAANARLAAEPANELVPLLVAGHKQRVQTLISEGFKLRWTPLAKANTYVPKLAASVTLFQDKVDEAIVRATAVRAAHERLCTCEYKSETIGAALADIQSAVDELNLGAFSNLPQWVAAVEARVEIALQQRLDTALTAWLAAFGSQSTNDGANKQTPAKRRDTADGDEAGEASEHDNAIARMRKRLTISFATHEVVIRNRQLTLEPPLEAARATWLTQLHQWLGVVCAQQRVRASRYDEGMAGGRRRGAKQRVDDDKFTYRNVATQVDASKLAAAFGCVEERLREVANYVDEWLRYQSLWDLEPSALYERLGDDVERWRRVLVEIKRSRVTFDNAQTQRQIGPLLVDYASVQASVNNKYDYWHRDVLREFGARLGTAMRGAYDELAAARASLEQQALDTSSPAAAVEFIVALQQVKRRLPEWGARRESLQTGQTLLRRQRHAFPPDWLDFAMLDGEWSALNELLRRKDAAAAAQIPALAARVEADSAQLASKVQALATAWPQSPACDASSEPRAALEALASSRAQADTLLADADRLTSAREALSLPPGAVADVAARLDPLRADMQALEQVWSALAGIDTELDTLGQTPWTSVIPRSIRKSLEEILERLKTFPARIRQYDAFSHTQQRVKQLLKHNIIISDLRSEALRERHWKALRTRLNVQWILSELTLGDIWRADLTLNGAAFRDIITQAQGELALEEYVKKVREHWQTTQLDLVQYQGKCKLIKSWDELFSTLQEHLGSLSSMRLSPFFKVFEDEATAWEERLNRMRVLFDVWIEVQRRWVYLESIFTGSGDIVALLPKETARFKSLNAEFVGLMRRVSKNPGVQEVVAIDGIQQTVDRLLDVLKKVQKALGDYLERQRASFPRFYFIGDEDLLEIIGNSKDIDKLQKHLRKMFAGLALLRLDESRERVIGMSSVEGEEVPFIAPVVLKSAPKVHQWLTRVECAMRLTLAARLRMCVADGADIPLADSARMTEWIGKWPAQLGLLAVQARFTASIEAALAAKDSQKALDEVREGVEALLASLAAAVLEDLPPLRRKAYEHLVTELVHQRDVSRRLLAQRVASPSAFEWLAELRVYYDSAKANEAAKQLGEPAEQAAGTDDPASRQLLDALQLKQANATFAYGWEYLGVGERLVQTPLTDRCYLTLTQAMHARMGGSPYGPAGTGKTETVKSLGGVLGRYTLVFCCDENFDLAAMSRIFIGLCMCGAWGCFDEFNRLEERILSAVSQQIQIIQSALAAGQSQVELGERAVPLSDDMGIFITMNPGYAGRTELPDNLKQLFRGCAMIRPDRELIGQVMLFSQGFNTAEKLAAKIVPLFKLCREQLSDQAHYDFGLRALKSVLVSAGRLKRATVQAAGDAASAARLEVEAQLLLRSVCETVVPKLVAADIALFHSLLQDVFPGVSYESVALAPLLEQVHAVCRERQLLPTKAWLDKLVQVYQMQTLHHGLMMVGPSSGKSTAWQVLLEAMERVDNVKGVSYVIDPKAIPKEQLFGTLDPTTREWTDGLFTHVLRHIIDNVRGDEHLKRHWIVFDGDVDPVWVENLNALLDDNKILTLPNGERLALPSNVRIMFEVAHLRYATPATVSRCGMVWFSEETLGLSTMLQAYLLRLRAIPLDENEKALHQRACAEAGKGVAGDGGPAAAGVDAASVASTLPGLTVQRAASAALNGAFGEGGVVERALLWAVDQAHIMRYTHLRVLTSTFALMNKAVLNLVERATSEDPLPPARADLYIQQYLLFALMWGVGGSLPLSIREEFSRQLATWSDTPVPSGDEPLLDYGVVLEGAEWRSWQERVPRLDIETHQVGSPDVVIATVDTVRHEEVLRGWLAEHRPLILCGPPGSGKTMTLQATLRSFPDFLFVSLNFSSATTPELILNTFQQYCEYKRTASGSSVLRPTLPGKWLVVFCDEINLPAEDAYGTQRVIAFMRQIAEAGGFWRSDHTWITLERIQFVGACNPPTDPGRVPLSPRFLRHAPLMLVDFPSRNSLVQIYGTFNRALLKLVPALRGHADALTEAMVDVYGASQKRFTPDLHAHYIYSPRELTRWVRALHAAIAPLDGACNLQSLLRLWAHEALRLFSDRLVARSERQWTDALLDRIAAERFGGALLADGVEAADGEAAAAQALERPILFSTWLTSRYESVSVDALRDYVSARLKVFYEEELDVPLVLFDEVLEHILRIDRVFRQPQGHALLIGVSGGGKTVLSRFVAWLAGLSVFTIKVNNRYDAEDFDNDLRTVMKRAGCDDEKICFIFDESNVLSSAFLERMNTLLAGGEVPGLFEDEEYTQLMHAVKTSAQRAGLLLDSDDELYRHFVKQVRTNLHVVFTMNPASPDFHNRSATSPALFNRCVIDWFGDWPHTAFYQVASEFTRNVDLEDPDYREPASFDVSPLLLPNPSPLTLRKAVIVSLVYVHSTIAAANARLQRTQGRTNYVTPRHFLDFIAQFVKMLAEKRSALEEEQLHLTVGLQKLLDTQESVQALQIELAAKNAELTAKNAEANEKLKQMVADQAAAEDKRRASVALQAKLDERNAEIQVQSATAKADLDKAEPALVKAQQAVSNIQRKHLDEIRALPKPPEKIRWTLEAVCMILSCKPEKMTWAEIRRMCAKSSFITEVAQFDSKSITPSVRKVLNRDYISQPDFNFETINRASRACGPLVEWVVAQVGYSDILDRVAPLRNQVAELEKAAQALVKQQQDLQQTVADLETSIAQYKTEYAALISETETIKRTMSDVERKVERSVALLDNLGSEQTRWQQQSESFQAELQTMVGDVLLCSAFLAYGGFFDQHFRDALSDQWRARLVAAGVPLKEGLAVSEYLSTPEQRLNWHADLLPTDKLCVENAIMLERFNRYPLVIDPSGQAQEFLMKHYADKRITKTSFLDAAFMKHLESALRFGCPLLVQDVENIDPVVNPVLNKEIYKKGGRILIRLGDQDIDFSPTFMIFLVTRDPTAHFTPDLCSRVTFVNFTVTPTGLNSQLLHETLRAERPDVHERRTDVLRLQGEYRVRLRALEKSLLTALNAASGNLLDDDSVLATLERLKTEAADVARKAADADTVMAELGAVSQQYAPFASACQRIYFALEELAQVHFLYQFSLAFFFSLFNDLLAGRVSATGGDVSSGAPLLLDGVTDPAERLDRLAAALFRCAQRRVSRSLLHADHVTFALRLAQIARQFAGKPLPEAEFEALLHAGEVAVAAAAPSSGDASDKQTSSDAVQAAARTAATLLARALPSAFAGVVGNEAALEAWMSEPVPASTPPAALVAPAGDAAGNALRTALLLNAVRPDRVPAALETLVASVFDAAFLHSDEVDLSAAASRAGGHSTPFLLTSAPGYDAGARVDAAAASGGRKLHALAIGSPEGFGLAETAIGSASKSGDWVLLKNIHLAPAWLVTLEKKLHTLTPHANFRLFLTSEIHPKLPASLLRLATVFVFEPPPGIKASMQHSLSVIGPNAFAVKPVERARLYFMLAWFHAVVLERLRYTPLGWTKALEFGETDLAGARATVDEWLTRVADGRNNIAPSDIPWAALRSLFGQSIYGGRVDNDYDQRLLDTLLAKLFRGDCFEAGFKLVDAGALQVTAPDGTKFEEFRAWVDALPVEQTPAWLGLPEDAERLLLAGSGRRALQNLLKMKRVEGDDDEAGGDDAGIGGDEGGVQPAWMTALRAQAIEWRDALPAAPAVPSGGADAGQPLMRFFAREIDAARKLRLLVHSDLSALVQVCDGTLKQTNHLRALISALTKGVVPHAWTTLYRVPPSFSAARWLVDFGARLRQFASLDVNAYGTASWSVAIGLLFTPHAFITATRQAAAKANGWSLESLSLRAEVDSGKASNASFVVSQLSSVAATWRDGALRAEGAMLNALPSIRFTWTPEQHASQTKNAALPLYLDTTRRDFLLEVALPADPAANFVERGACIVANRTD